MKRVVRLIGSIKIAVPLLVAIAGVLAWGTIYESSYGTAAVQRFIYTSWWFQAILGFLAVNLAVAALDRYPWKRQHIPFVLAHLGIICILVGGIIGGRFGIEGQMIIPEGQAQKIIEAPNSILAIHEPGNDSQHIIPVKFESQAWVHEPNLHVPVRFAERTIDITVDRYYPDAIVNEAIGPDGDADNPAVRVLLEHEAQEESFWLFSRNPERFGMGWAEAHVLFLEPQSQEQYLQLTGGTAKTANERGAVSIKLPGSDRFVDIPVPAQLDKPLSIPGSAYKLSFKDYFPDFVMGEKGLSSRSDQPNNPAVSFVLSGPEGEDAYLLFALHPDFQSMHGFKHQIPAEVRYNHSSAAGSLPPQAIAIVLKSNGALMAVMTDAQGKRTLLDKLEPGVWQAHPELPYRFQVAEFYAKAAVNQSLANRSNEVRAQAVRVIAKEGGHQAQAWVMLRDSAGLSLGDKKLSVEFRPPTRELPVTIKLLDFRKITYPGIDMAAGFESDVQLSDTERGVILMRKISMNNPLRYRGYSFFQSSFVDGPTQTTILSVRNDPGTWLVYAGFVIVILGVVLLFVLRAKAASKSRR